MSAWDTSMRGDSCPFVVMYIPNATNGATSVIARCCDWDDALEIANRHTAAYIYNTENGKNYYRRVREVVEYMPEGWNA
jgi:aromatic ring hydroxylase